MSKFLFKALFAFFTAALFLFPSSAEMRSDAYNISEYNIDMSVNSDNSYDISETLTVEFLQPRHGIYRDISLATVYGRAARISNVRVSGAPYTSTREGKLYSLKIGDPDSYADDTETYEISYRYTIGNDYKNGYDELYFNLIGSQWDCAIDSVIFTITMPSGFDASQLVFHSGDYGETSSITQYEVNGSVITGRTTAPLGVGQALTVALPLPEGYFTPAVTFSDFLIWIAAALAVLFLFVSLILYFKFGKSRRLFPPVEFYPPDNITPADAGYLVDGVINPSDMTTLIIYFADKGYLRIEERDKETYLLPVRAPDNNAAVYEHTIYNALAVFAGPDGEVAVSSLREKFYTYIASASAQLRSKWSFGANRYFDIKGRVSAVASVLMTLFTGVLTALSFIDRMGIAYGTEAFIVSLVGGGVLTLALSCAAFALTGTSFKSGASRKGAVAVSCVLYALTLIFCVAFTAGGFYYVLPFFISGFIMTSAAARSWYKRTPYGDTLCERMLGFREFIRAAEIERLEKLIKDDAEYFYHVLPYAMIFGLTAQWSKKFDALELRPPSWYGGQYSAFDAYMFSRLSANMMANMSSAMTSRSQPKGGGGSSFGGGGFSGGGSGGGGGGSW